MVMSTRFARRLPLVLALVATALAVALPAAAKEAEVEFEGGGWGHGVGMSQYGAKAKAVEGRSASQIIEYYYSGAQVAPMGSLGLKSFLADDPDPLWIGLAQSVPSVDLLPWGLPMEVCDGDGCVPLEQGSPMRVVAVDEGCEVGPVAGWPEGAVVMDCALDVDLNGSPSGVEVPGVCVAGSCDYGRGILHLRPANDGLHVVLELDIDEYLYGLAEVPSSWPAAALGAQVITARSYALRKANSYGPESGFSTWRQDLCWCHLVDDTRDQAYRGLQWESAAWRGAVDAATGKVVAYGGSIISTFYSSSTGGATEDVEDVWGGSPDQYPYLRSVPDPWSVSAAADNPYASWTRTLTAASVARTLGWDRVTGATLLEAAPGARLRLSGEDGGAPVTRDLSGERARTLFGLRSGGLERVRFVAASPGGASAGSDGGGGFTDIGGSQHASAILAIADAGITKGCNPPLNDQFCPTDTITRGQLAAFFTRALDLATPAGNPFTDDDGSVFENDIEALAAAGITRGCNPPANTRFCPNEPVTRGQAAAFFARALGLPPAPGDAFTDDDDSVFEGDIQALAAAGITKGCNPPANTAFCPDAPITREQFATFLFRAFLSG